MIRLAIGIGMTLAAWAIARTVAGAWGSRRVWGWALDLAVPLIMFAIVLSVTGKPLVAGALTFALIGGFAFADYGKREVLREPVVFTDLSELWELVRHPHLYLPFVGTGRVVAGAAAGAAAFLAGLILEPSLWPLSPLTVLAGVAGSSAFVFGLATVGVGPLGRLLGRFKLAGDPVVDSAALGGLASQFAYGVPTRAARAMVRANAPVRPALMPTGGLPDIVLVQGESFFDARRADPTITADLLPAFDRLRVSGQAWGKLASPTWGASTTRTEFAVLTGRPAETLGLDRFNPYHELARRPLESLASRLKAAGYRTVCVHPYDRRFYGRDKVMPALGFDEFHGEEAFAGAPRSGRYITDLAAAEFSARLLAASDQPTFIFLVTMENHGPWTGFDTYLAGLRATDTMIGPLVEALERRGDGVLGLYGDHMPSLPFPAEAGTSTDYALWRAGGEPRAANVDLAAHDLGEALLAVAGLTTASGDARAAA